MRNKKSNTVDITPARPKISIDPDNAVEDKKPAPPRLPHSFTVRPDGVVDLVSTDGTQSRTREDSLHEGLAAELTYTCAGCPNCKKENTKTILCPEHVILAKELRAQVVDRTRLYYTHEGDNVGLMQMCFYGWSTIEVDFYAHDLEHIEFLRQVLRFCGDCKRYGKIVKPCEQHSMERPGFSRAMFMRYDEETVRQVGWDYGGHATMLKDPYGDFWRRIQSCAESPDSTESGRCKKKNFWIQTCHEHTCTFNDLIITQNLKECGISDLDLAAKRRKNVATSSGSYCSIL